MSQRAAFAFLVPMLLGLSSVIAQELTEWEIPEKFRQGLDPKEARPAKKPKSTHEKPVAQPPPGNQQQPLRKPRRPAVRPPLHPVVPMPPATDAPSTKLEDKKKASPARTGKQGRSNQALTNQNVAVKDKPTKQQQDQKPFVKGELANFIGSTKLVTKNNRIGVRLGYRLIDYVHYLTLSPEADLRIGSFEVGLGVPVALQLFNSQWDEEKNHPVAFDDLGSLRTEDWDEPGEFARFIRYLTYGKKEDRLFFNISQHASTSVGHGPLMRRYSVNIDPDSTRVSGEIDAYNDYAGFEFVANSIVDWDIFGGIGFIKPLSFFFDSPVARSLSLGFTYLVDRHAPVTLKTRTEGSENKFWVVGKGRPEIQTEAVVQALGVDLEIKILKTEHVDLKPFIDYSWLLPQDASLPQDLDPAGGGGLTIGLLGRFNYGTDPVHAMRAILEFRSFSSTYLPAYFDTFYEVHKFIANQNYKHYATTTGELPPTKFEDVFVERKSGDRHLGFYLEFNYALVDYLTFTLALEGSDAEGGSNFLAHLEVPAFSWLQFFFSFHQHAMEDLGNLFSNDNRDKIVLAAARLRALPFLFFNFRYHHTFRLREGGADLTGDGFENQYRYYDTTHAWLADFELGWEF